MPLKKNAMINSYLLQRLLKKGIEGHLKKFKCNLICCKGQGPSMSERVSMSTFF